MRELQLREYCEHMLGNCRELDLLWPYLHPTSPPGGSCNLPLSFLLLYQSYFVEWHNTLYLHSYWMCDTINRATATLHILPLSVCSCLTYSLWSCSADGFTFCLPPAAEGHTESSHTLNLCIIGVCGLFSPGEVTSGI